MKHVLAQMPGTIIEIAIEPGDTVLEGQEIMVLEAMKMENSIVAPCNGRVAEVRVQKGNSVGFEQVLMTIE